MGMRRRKRGKEEKHMKKLLSAALCLCMLFTMAVCAMAEGYVPGTYTGKGQGFTSVSVTVTVDANAITAVSADVSTETPGFGKDHQAEFEAAVMEAQGADIDIVASCSLTTAGINEAVADALAQARGEAANDAPVSFTAGAYTASAAGYNAPVEVTVTFSESAITAIEVTKHAETNHVGNVAFQPMIEDMLAANGSGVDAVAGATFSSAALRNAVNAAAEQAGCTNMAAFKSATVVHTAQEPIEGTWDVVIVGAGGAGLAAAAQAAQNGDTVVLLEKAAEMGGNTLVAGGAYQSVMPYLVWDATIRMPPPA